MNIVLAAGIMAAIFLISGILCLAASLMNWEWFFRSDSIRILTYRLSRRWQRTIYTILGVLMLLMSYIIITLI